MSLIKGNRWTFAALVIALIMLMPILSIGVLALFPAGNVWAHLISNVLPDAVRETLALMIGVGCFALLWGVLAAWLVTFFDFPGRSVLSWAMMLPLAMPTYIVAFCYVEILDFSGPVQSGLRALTGWRNYGDYYFPDVKSLWGAVFVFSSVLFPYVYLTARASFLRQSAQLMDAARLLGCHAGQAFWRVALPLARPALAAGVALAMMECLNDIGAVEYLGVNTLTITVYSTWLDRSNLGGAAQISLFLLGFVLILILLERLGRRGRRYAERRMVHHVLTPVRLDGLRGLGALAFLLFLLGIGFVFPAMLLVHNALIYQEELWRPEFWQIFGNSIMVSLAVAGLVLVLALVLAYAVRLANGARPVVALARLSSIGYAVPGTVLAIGILIPFAAFDNALNHVSAALFGVKPGLVFSGTVVAIIIACSIRFMAVAYGAVESGMQKISPSLDWAARTLGLGRFAVLRQILLPLLRPAFGAALLLVFVDTMKELPATLLLRPFNFDTLATYVYTRASLDEFEEAALASLAIVLAGVLPIIWLQRSMEKL